MLVKMSEYIHLYKIIKPFMIKMKNNMMRKEKEKWLYAVFSFLPLCGSLSCYDSSCWNPSISGNPEVGHRTLGRHPLLTSG